jgi:NitT/TauT family transport system ATP-binding protein
MTEPDSKPDAIVFEDVSKTFSGGQGATLALDNLSFSIHAGEYACILGRSGCGKSTAANLVLGLDRPTSGRIRVFGENPARDFARLRGRLGSVFQSDRLLPWRTAVENVRLPLEILKISESSLRVDATDWLTRLGLQGFEESLPHQLSGGMRQRVALARALVAEPDIVVADEAFAHLDEVTGERLRRDFHQLSKETGKTVIHITHSIDEALSLGDRIFVLGKPGHLLAAIDDVQLKDRAALRSHILTHLQGPARQTAKATAIAALTSDPAALSQEWAT